MLKYCVDYKLFYNLTNFVFQKYKHYFYKYVMQTIFYKF